jgi:phosphoglycerate dehydrogenase-like enzyme
MIAGSPTSRNRTKAKASTVRTFRIAFTGDFLNEHKASAYGDLDLGPLERARHVSFHFLSGQTPNVRDLAYWERFYSLEVTPDDVRDIEGLVVLRPWVKRGALAGAENLVVIGRSGSGYDKIDVSACSEHDVALFNAPLALNHSTASSALLFMLALAKRLPQQERVARAGRWDLQAAVMGSEIQGRTLGIIGLGHSGRELVRLVAPFEMNVLAYSPHADRPHAAALGVQLVSLEEVLSTADFVSLHVRLTADNHGLIGRAQLALMKPTAFVINVARGELVDQPALVDALREREIAGAALDVYEHEPLPLDDPLAALDNVILTPHWSASTTDVFAATSRAMTEGMLRASRGEVPDNVVNREVLERPGFRAKLAQFSENHPRRADG